MENLTIKISAADVAMLRRIARATNRRFDDFLLLVFAEGLQMYFCDEGVSVKKLPEEYTDAEIKQQELNEKIKKEIRTGWEDMKAAGFAHVDERFNNCGTPDTFIEPMVERIRDICLN
jgi:hypothetical protein